MRKSALAPERGGRMAVFSDFNACADQDNADNDDWDITWSEFALATIGILCLGVAATLFSI